jgi:hypothetical protein
MDVHIHHIQKTHKKSTRRIVATTIGTHEDIDLSKMKKRRRDQNEK